MSEISRLRIALQKSGRLSEDSFDLLEKAGLRVRVRSQRLIAIAENLPVEVLLVRDDDIPGLVMDGTVDLGIVGEGVLEETKLAREALGLTASYKVSRRLDFGECRLGIAIPMNEPWQSPQDLSGRRIATSFPNLLGRWMKEQGSEGGWITAEYSMLPYSTIQRKSRDISRGKIDGRSQEIQRLIGRVLRSAVDLKLLGQRSIYIDCDVIQADGGTRTASITGGFVALRLALDKLLTEKKLEKDPVFKSVAAVSVGIVNGEVLLDLNYQEDSIAEVDMNVVMTSDDEFCEIQGTAEKGFFTSQQLQKLITLAQGGIKKLINLQNQIISSEG